MAITRWDPFSDVRSLARRMERAFEPLLSATSLAEPEGLLAPPMGSWPAVDIYEDKEEIVVRAEVPGMEQKDVEVILEDSTLTLRGNRKLFKEEKRENYQRIEACYGTFSRSFSMPSTIDRDKIRADMKNGVLEVHIVKREGAKGKTIPVNA